MSSTTAISAFLAVALAVAGFTGFSISAPVSYPAGAVYEGDLIRQVVFDKASYDYLTMVDARLVYFNPSDEAITVNVTYPVIWHLSIGGRSMGSGGTGMEGQWELISVPARGEYIADYAGFLADNGVGWCEIEWDGAVAGAEIRMGDIVPRIVTDKRVYRAGVGIDGTAVFELYNPTGHNATTRLPGCMDFSRVNPDGTRDGLSGVCIDWVWSNKTITPGGSFKIWTFYFATPQAGLTTIEGAGARTTVVVVPR